MDDSREIAKEHAIKVRAEWMREVDGWTQENVDAFTHPPAEWIIDAIQRVIESDEWIEEK